MSGKMWSEDWALGDLGVLTVHELKKLMMQGNIRFKWKHYIETAKHPEGYFHAMCTCDWYRKSYNYNKLDKLLGTHYAKTDIEEDFNLTLT